ncbi:hypothetical protein CKSOR_00188 [Candidatus Kinetoplastibacterium sorsogonicusi]|uniref:DNA recombination protein RmuC n=1 Tax=Candidatus Kinetoplastidibacterium kentomonadis TaxID=1576550 RepID=A0A3S7J9H1_9PROT|nr:DNA recombination protein RmuC [Candidatus Kinetoplastibacterium sorsogonicusi]AWD32315.1 hypothetical protein CKSOR_00188 [Candidatus Kinetoplastibacterium sorsogonicusi]
MNLCILIFLILLVISLLTIFIVQKLILNNLNNLKFELEKVSSNLNIDIDEYIRKFHIEFNEFSRDIRIDSLNSNNALKNNINFEFKNTRSELVDSLNKFSNHFANQIQKVIEIDEKRMLEVRNILNKNLYDLQKNNTDKLEEIRIIVDEKLTTTLENRLGESFKLVSERLESVHKGLGEMHSLASGVGDLKRILSNVKTRGIWGEMQLSRIITDIMTEKQYACNVKPIPGSDAIVEFAIKLPGTSNTNVVWLPIDSKFPIEEYERLCEAYENSDSNAIKKSILALGKAVELQAKIISNKYVAPPYTTEFAIMFLPAESLYAEILRIPGLLDKLYKLRINISGPSNLAAILNSLQMGFHTLAIERRSSEVWQVLKTVKTEFYKFGDTVASVRKNLESATNKLDQTETRSRIMLKNLKHLEILPEDNNISDVFDDN